MLYFSRMRAQKLSLPPINILRDFSEGEDGNIAIASTFFLVIILMFSGVGIDFMRYERDRVKLQSVLDNAVLAAADLDQTQDPTLVVHEHFTSAGLSKYLDGVYVTESEYSRQVTGTISSSWETSFMKLSGVESLSTNLSATAIENAPDTEISLLLDISGSMKTNDRVTIMRQAAKEFLTRTLERNTLSNTGGDNPFQTTVNVVPFAGQTNPGPEMFDYMGGERFGTTEKDNFFDEWPQDISNITFWFDTGKEDGSYYSAKIDSFPDGPVDKIQNLKDLDSYYGYAIDYIIKQNPSLSSDDYFVGATIKGGKEPTSYYQVIDPETGEPLAVIDPQPITEGDQTKFNKVDMEVDFWDFYNSLPPNNESSCLEMAYSDFFSTDLPDGTDEQVPYFVNWDFDEVTQNWGWCPDDEMSIQYAQSDIESLHGFVDNLRLFDGTGTNYGMKYALALLDPNTQPAFEYLSGEGLIESKYSNRPLDWNAKDSSKFIVLMTDGRTSQQVRPEDEYETENMTTELTARPTDESVVESSQLSNYQLFLEQCKMARDLNVIVYVVAFETSATAAEEIKQCASSPSHFYEVSGPELVDAFVSVASSIQHLRLVQ